MKSLFLIFVVFLAGCSSSTSLSGIQQISAKGQFIEKHIQAPPFLLTSYEKINDKNGMAHIYIEGDGRAWLSKKRPSLDPTPKNPVAFKLAAKDPTHNVVYLARPCQYTKMINGTPCDQKYWTSHRFAPEVIEAMNNALEDIKQRHQLTRFHLIGFSGGGNIAPLLANRRDDILSLRTVAGNLDHQLQSKIHNVSPMLHSLSAKDIAHHISHIPQIHFIGREDKIVPYPLYESYKNASGASQCVRSQIVEGVSHIKGWESMWKSLLNKPFNCQ